MRRKLTYKECVERTLGVHFVIEGTVCHSVGFIFNIAKSRGYNGSRAGIAKRLKAGDKTWEALCRPVAENRRCAADAKTKSVRSSKNEMAKLIADLDARKAALAEASSPTGEDE